MIARLRAGGYWLYRISDRLVGVFLAIGLLSTPIQHVAYFRTVLIGHSVVPPTAGLAVLVLGVAIAWRSLLRRDFVWADPARLTWLDTRDSRVGTIGRRLWAGWAVRFAAVAYLTAIGVLWLGETSWLPAGGALFCAVAVLAIALARRAPGRIEVWLEQAIVLAAAVLAGFAAVRTVGSAGLWLVAAVAVVGIGVSVLGSGPPRRPAVASRATRDVLVRGYLRRVVRRVSVAFGDALALLPPPATMPWPKLLAGRAVVVRFMVGGIAARSRSLLPVALFAVAVGVAHQVFPLVTPLWLIGVGLYFACLPLASPLAALFGVPGLRRWFGCTDLTLRLATAAVVVVPVLVWLGVVAIFAVPVSVAAWLAVPLAIGAAIRTVTRAPLDYGNIGVGTTPGGNLLPIGLLIQLAHGPDLLVIGLLVIGSGLAIMAVAPVALGLAAYGVAR